MVSMKINNGMLDSDSNIISRQDIVSTKVTRTNVSQFDSLYESCGLVLSGTSHEETGEVGCHLIRDKQSTCGVDRGGIDCSEEDATAVGVQHVGVCTRIQQGGKCTCTVVTTGRMRRNLGNHKSDHRSK